MVGSMHSGQSHLVNWVINNWQYLFYADRPFVVDEDGKTLYYAYTTDEYREAMKAVNLLLDEGLTSEVCWTFKSSTELRTVTQPADGVPIAGVVIAHNAVAYSGTPGPDLIWEYVPLAPFNYAPLMSNSLKGTIYWHITEDAADPEAAFRVMMAMATHEGYMAGKYGVEGRDWEYQRNDKGEIIGMQKTPDTAANVGEGTKVHWYQTPHSTLINAAK
jgi:putative aldouronate transport system substrate-binding protein